MLEFFRDERKRERERQGNEEHREKKKGDKA